MKDKLKTKRLPVSMTEDQHKLLKRMSLQTGESMSSILLKGLVMLEKLDKRVSDIDWEKLNWEGFNEEEKECSIQQ